MAAIKFSTVQQAMADALEAIAAVSGSKLAGVPVIVQTFEAIVPDTNGTRVDPQLKAALADEGIAFLIGFPGSRNVDAAANAASLLAVPPPLSLHFNPTKLYGTGGLGVNPYEIVDELIPAMIGRATVPGAMGGQRWHVDTEAPVGQPRETILGLMIPLNASLPIHFTRTP